VEDASAAVVENLRGEARVREAFSSFEQHFHAPVSSMDIHKYVGLVLADGLSGAEENLMEKIGDRTDIFFIGGSAGDDLKFQSTHVFHQGKAYTNAAVLVLLRLKRGFEILKTQSFHSTGKVLTATKVDEPLRKVLEFNHQPAVTAYAAALGVPAESLPGLFMKHPLGLMVDEEPFVRSPQRVDGESILFYCQIKQGMDLEVLEGTDIVADTRKAIEARMSASGPIAGIIDFQCILRTLELRAENHCEQYGAIFSGFAGGGFQHLWRSVPRSHEPDVDDAFISLAYCVSFTLWAGPPGPRPTPTSASSSCGGTAGPGVRRGRGRPPHVELCG
jgi:hypothetical protein